MVLYSFIGADAFLGRDLSISEDDVRIGALCIFLFVVSMQIPYVFGSRVALCFWDKKNLQASNNFADRRGLRRVKGPTILLFFPLSIVFLFYFSSLKGFSVHELFSKVDFTSDGQYTTLYFLQKLGFFIKIPFYMVLLKALSVRGSMNRSDKNILIISTILTSALFLFSGQRSGIFITILELSIVLSVVGTINFRVMALLMLGFLVANVGILSVRFAGLEEVSIIELFLRRYFFDIEKIAGIYSYIKYSPPIPAGENLHFFIGGEIFNTHAGVPPSFLGEVIIYFGVWFVIPATFLAALLAKRVEILIRDNRSPLITMVAVIVLSHWIYFSLNSDVFSFLKRATFDVCLLLMGYFLFAASIQNRSKSNDLKDVVALPSRER
jgi:hypothetical protein